MVFCVGKIFIEFIMKLNRVFIYFCCFFKVWSKLYVVFVLRSIKIDDLSVFVVEDVIKKCLMIELCYYWGKVLESLVVERIYVMLFMVVFEWDKKV